MQIARDFAIRTFKQMCEDAGTVLSLQFKDWAASGRFDLIINYEFDFKSDRSVEDFGRDYALYNYLRKYEGPLLGVDTSAVAYESFKNSEERNLLTNRRLKTSSGFSGAESILSNARRKIMHVLGVFDYDEWFRSCGWGPGATATLQSQYATLEEKMLERPMHVSPRSVRFINAQFASDYAWAKARDCRIEGPTSFLADEFLAVDCSRFTTVPKDCKTDRTIDIQPTGNLFLQKGIGKMIRNRLKRVGVDLDDQSRNQDLAKQARLCGYATIDLANASNTISRGIVELLLGDNYAGTKTGTWYQHLVDTRVAYTSLPNGDEHFLEMFSAMGNGYTFELESLIFWALSSAVVDEISPTDRVVAVYGDDIIVSAEAAPRLVEVLTLAGFEINTRKTFLCGDFYESCGKHFYKDFDVTPAIQKEQIVDLPSCIRNANRLIRLAVRLQHGDCELPLWMRSTIDLAVDYCRYQCPKSIALPLQPIWLEGDGGLIDLTGSLKPFKIDQYTVSLLLLRDVGVYRVTHDEAFYALRMRKDATMAWVRDDLASSLVGQTPFLGKMPIRGRSRYLLNERRIPLAWRPFSSW